MTINIFNFAVMKRNKGKYREVDRLPKEAMTITEFAAHRNISLSYVYHRFTRGRADYEIVTFKTMNFVLAK